MRGYFWLSFWVLMLVPALASGQVRKWTTRTGDLTVEGELLDVTSGNVVLKKADGTNVSIAVDRLSLSDLRYVQQVLREATAAVGTAPAANVPPANVPAANAPAANAPPAANSAPSAASTPPNKPATNPPAGDEGGPPLTRANSSRWQVAPDPPRGAGGDAVRINDVSISLPGGWIAGELCLPATPSPFIGYASRSSPLTFLAWDLRNGDRFGPIPFEGYTQTAALSPDGSLVASWGSTHNRLQLWSLKDRSLALEIDVGEKFFGSQTLAFASPTRLLVHSRNSRGSLRVFDTQTGKEVAKISDTPPYEKHGLGISPGGHYVAFSADNQLPLRMYDLRNGELAGELEIPGGQRFRVNAVAFSPDGNEIAVLNEAPGLALYCWSLETGKLVVQHTFQRSLRQFVDGTIGYQGPRLEFIPRSQGKDNGGLSVPGWLVCGRAVIDRTKGGPVWVAKTVNHLDERAPRKLLDADRQLILTGEVNQQQISIAQIPWKEISESAAVVERGGTAADAGLPRLTNAVMEGATKVEIPSPPPAWSVPLDPAPVVTGLTAEPIAIAPTAQIGPRWLLATAAAKAVVAVRADKDSGYPYLFKYRRIDLKTGQDDGGAAPGFKTALHDVSPDGSRIAVIASPETERVDVYDLGDGQHVVGLRPFTGGEPSTIKLRSAALVTNDRLLTLSSGGKMVLWSLPDCRAIYQCDAPVAQRIVPLSHGHKFMLVEADGVLYALDAATAQPLGALESVDRQPGEYLQAFEFSPDGRAVAVLFRQRVKATLVVWSLETGKLLHRHPLATSWDVTWVDSSRLLIHHPLEISRPATGLTYSYAPVEVPPRRYDLFDLGLGRRLWRYQLSRGDVSSQSLDGRTWFLAAKDYREPAKLQGLVIPGPETAQAIANAPVPKNLLPRNTAVTLDLSVKISGDPIADQALSDAVRKQLSEVLSKRGLKVQERSSLALRIELRERLTGQWLELRPILGGIAGTYRVKGTELECTAMLADITGKSLWKEQQVIEVRQELPQPGLPQGIQPGEYVRQQQWNDALKWLTTSGIPTEILEGWAHAGMGESVLSPAGETRLALDVPGAGPGKSKP